MNEAIKPTTETKRPNVSTEHQRDGDARRPSDTLDRGQDNEDGRHDVAPVEPRTSPRNERSGGRTVR